MKTLHVLRAVLLSGFVLGAGVSGARAAAPSDKTEILKTTVYALTETGLGAPLGTLTLHDSARGLVIVPDLMGLPAGPHGFHLHENSDCGPMEKGGVMVPGLAAGGHFDPDKTGKHAGPHGTGHKGDLPVLNVGKDGKATQALIAPRLKLEDARHHSFIVHEGGDNYSDDPKPLGGGGNRIACAAIP
jgi:superoxide dismutase, Cu-Zn family